MWKHQQGKWVPQGPIFLALLWLGGSVNLGWPLLTLESHAEGHLGPAKRQGGQARLDEELGFILGQWENYCAGVKLGTAWFF